jgi:hypothetical protein
VRQGSSGNGSKEIRREGEKGRRKAGQKGVTKGNM